MIYAMGDIHGKLEELLYMLTHLVEGDTVVLLGDNGLNFYKDGTDVKRKRRLSIAALQAKVDILIVRGNHDIRPSDIESYSLVDYKGARAWIESEFPYLYFAEDGGVYEIEGQRVLTIGGAYSVDKYYRLDKNWPWFPNEQLSEKEREFILDSLDANAYYDLVFTHTCPYNFRPLKDFLDYKVEEDFTMEIFLQQVYNKIEKNFGSWMCGHFHHSRQIAPRVRVLGINEILPTRWED